ncbi:translation initiation factor IF-3-like [Hydractinia symbiolongicarpus]|uniref:translation initiation factor IF-3-like n=1 Tax=Hydractinia symbiolongicarpus TaxID=13093 RepID=UPI0025503852|nr:translation initiation factor IF-3-like [Hydractinia symbiolongicarpus]
MYRCIFRQYVNHVFNFAVRTPKPVWPVNRYLTSDTFVRLIDENGQNLGVVSKMEAKNIAKSKQLELKEVSKANQKTENSVFKIVNKISQQKTSPVESRTMKSKELTMKSQIEDQDLNVKAKKLQTFLDKGYKVTLKISKPRQSHVTPRQAYEKLIVKLNCEVKLAGTPKESEKFFRCVVYKGEEK